MQKVTEEWTPTGVKSIFILSLGASTDTVQRPTSVGAGVQYTAICGFGWRFSFRVDPQSAPAVVVDDTGNTIESFQLQLFFDPHLIRAAAYGAITLTTQVENLISPQQAPAPVTLTLPRSGSDTPSLGSYVYASTAPAPVISIMFAFPATLGLTLPHPLEPQMEQALEETLEGNELVDIKFYAFSRRGLQCVTHPLPLFAKSALLQGFSDDLDAFLSGRGFSESEVVVDLDSHEAEDRSFEDYGYGSDSDLDSEDEEEPAPPPKASPSTGKSKPASGEACNKTSSPRTEQGARMGRVIVLKDTAFKTWKALLYYLYTRRVNFRPLKSEGPKEITATGPLCSPKSMYRLADKLGLEELRTLALASISSRLSEGNILEEVFSSFTSVYPVIQELEVGVLTSNFSEKASTGLKEMTEKLCQGEKPYCAEILFKIISKMAIGAGASQA
ncbi:hypothetical protein DFH08DRAFT_887579 [Mycena albidolilacea]|uniref:BTB domain-containing protein n=1 Tax=Mycena albidolilacea TaxID=1033008 RepID=A0AAD6ZIF5_9AGAR|nr:hypothetical protein DFH08DRAFT_887579 [Mycena albidolilacea]